MRAPGPKTVSDSVRYGFAVGKVRVLETRIFGKATYERLLDAPTLVDQLRVLSDTHYGRYLENATTAGRIERGLEEALDGFYGFLGEAKLPSSVVRFFRLRHDYANLKAKLKADTLGVPTDGMLSGLGTVPATEFEGPGESLPEPFRGLYLELSMPDTLQTSPDLGGIDAAVDRAAFAALLEEARASGSEFLTGLARLLIDVANVKTALRARRRGVTPVELKRLLLAGGAVSVEDLLRAYLHAAGDFAELVSRVPLLGDLPPETLTDPSQLDVLADDLVVRYLQRARRVSIGAEPVIAYVMAREAEVVALRVLLIGRLAGVPSEVLRERMRELYI